MSLKTVVASEIKSEKRREMEEEDLDFGKKVSIKEEDTMEVDQTKIVLLLRSFLDIQQRRAQAYSKLKGLVCSSA